VVFTTGALCVVTVYCRPMYMCVEQVMWTAVWHKGN
jgi:hypothetical protein